VKPHVLAFCVLLLGLAFAAALGLEELARILSRLHEAISA
jgi:hypothetical protein